MSIIFSMRLMDTSSVVLPLINMCRFTASCPYLGNFVHIFNRNAPRKQKNRGK